MSCIIYLSLSGSKQGLISEGCGSVSSIGNKSQIGHNDEIFVYELNYGAKMGDSKILSPLVIRKPIDKSSPILLQSVSDNEMLDCTFNFFRTSNHGVLENYYKIKLHKARVIDLYTEFPHGIAGNESQPEEVVVFKFATISVEHIIANTSGWAAWKDE